MNNRQIDAAVAEAMGLEVLGEAWADQDPEVAGWWHVHDREWDGRSLQPVYLAHCACDIHPLYADDPVLAECEPAPILGHYPGCLEVVKHYSSDIAAAWEVVEWIREQPRFGEFRLSAACDGWREDTPVWCATFDRFEEEQGAAYQDYTAFAETAPLAICRAFLKAMGAEVAE